MTDGPAKPVEGGIQIEEPPEPPFDWREHGLEDLPAFLIFWGLTVIVFLQFFTRYVLNDSLAWTEEAARYFLIALAFVGGGLVCRRRANIAVEYLHTLISRDASRWLMIVCELISAAFWAYLVYIGWRLIGVMGGQRMAVIDLTMAWLYWVVLAGLVGMVLRTLQSIWRRIQGDSPWAGDI